jgi:predicted XRE-type DNA-binding protein
MNKAERESLEAAGWRIGDYGDFLELTDDEREIVELRFRLAKQIRERREKAKMTQEALAVALASTQPRVAKIEAAARGVSLDQLFRAYFVVGGKTEQLFLTATPQKGNKSVAPAPKKSSKAAKPGTVSTRKKPVGA